MTFDMRAKLLGGFCALGFIACSGLAVAQTLPESVKQKLLETGPDYTAETRALFTPLYAPLPKDISVSKNVSYGSHPREILDIYQPGGKTKLPIMVYMHGGSYTSGSKDQYDNIPAYFARHGMVGVNIEYRLAPEFSFPAGAEDVGKAVAWLKQNAAKYGGDPNRIWLMGHSAGATHVATYAFDRRFQPLGGSGIAGVILVSGRYHVHDAPDDPSYGGVRAYFGSDPSKYEERSITSHVANSHVRVMMAATEFDQKNLAATSGEMFAALCERDGGQCPRFLQLKYHNHLSEMASIGTSDDLLGREILEFIGQDGAPTWPTSK